MFSIDVDIAWKRPAKPELLQTGNVRNLMASYSEIRQLGALGETRTHGILPSIKALCRCVVCRLVVSHKALIPLPESRTYRSPMRGVRESME